MKDLLELKNHLQASRQVIQCATEEQLHLLKKQLNEMFGTQLPEAHLLTLVEINGFNFNATFFYGTHNASQGLPSIIDRTVILMATPRNSQTLIMVGESPLGLYVWHPVVKSYFLVHSETWNPLQRFIHFDDMFQSLLSDALD